MKAELHELDSAHLDVLLHEYAPQDPGYFGILIEARIGPVGEVGSDLFYFLVRSPRWLAIELDQESYFFGRDCLILPRFDYGLLRRAISELCDSIEGPDWETVARRIGRYGLWEYDDFYGPPNWGGSPTGRARGSEEV